MSGDPDLTPAQLNKAAKAAVPYYILVVPLKALFHAAQIHPWLTVAGVAAAGVGGCTAVVDMMSGPYRDQTGIVDGALDTAVKAAPGFFFDSYISARHKACIERTRQIPRPSPLSVLDRVLHTVRIMSDTEVRDKEQDAARERSEAVARAEEKCPLSPSTVKRVPDRGNASGRLSRDPR